MTTQNFIEQCIAGSAHPSEIDDFVDQWHAGGAQGVELCDFLGMSQVECAAWMQDPSALDGIMVSRGYVSKGKQKKLKCVI